MAIKRWLLLLHNKRRNPQSGTRNFPHTPNNERNSYVPCTTMFSHYVMKHGLKALIKAFRNSVVSLLHKLGSLSMMIIVWYMSGVCSCITSTLDKHHSTCQTVYSQFLHSVADTGWGRLAQRITFCEERELDLENEVPPTVAQPPGTLFLPTSTTLLTPVHSKDDSRVYFMIVLTTDWAYCRRSWTCRIAAPYNFHVDWLTDWLTETGQRLCNERKVTGRGVGSGCGVARRRRWFAVMC